MQWVEEAKASFDEENEKKIARDNETQRLADLAEAEEAYNQRVSDMEEKEEELAALLDDISGLETEIENA